MKPTPQQKAAARRMRRDHPDMSVRQIAAKLGINSGTVSKWLRQPEAETSLSIEGLIAQTQQNFENLPPSEAERLRDLRDSLREQQQVIIKRQIKLLESVQGEAMTALRSKDLPTVRAAASLISALTRAFAHEGAVYGIIDPAEAMRQALKDD
ncbi:TPA: helix-turn-helix domain-containing protein [Kluyvera georgiana]